MDVYDEARGARCEYVWVLWVECEGASYGKRVAGFVINVNPWKSHPALKVFGWLGVEFVVNNIRGNPILRLSFGWLRVEFVVNNIRGNPCNPWLIISFNILGIRGL